MEPATPPGSAGDRTLPPMFWLYLLGMALVAVRYADFNLVSYHLQRTGELTGVIPLLYTLAMGTAGLSALVVGRWFDRRGMGALIVAVLVAATFAPLAFLGSLPATTVGIAPWGVGMGVQDSLMSAPVSMMTRAEARSRALGVFNALYGIAWFAGSSVLGAAYGFSILAIVLISVIAQGAGALVPFRLRNRFAL